MAVGFMLIHVRMILILERIMIIVVGVIMVGV